MNGIIPNGLKTYILMGASAIVSATLAVAHTIDWSVAVPVIVPAIGLMAVRHGITTGQAAVLKTLIDIAAPALPAPAGAAAEAVASAISTAVAAAPKPAPLPTPAVQAAPAPQSAPSPAPNSPT